MDLEKEEMMRRFVAVCLLLGMTATAKESKPIRGWGAVEVLGLGLGGVTGETEYFDDGFYYDVTLARVGVGFAPPIGAGIWLKLGRQFRELPTSSIRLTYTPFLSWREKDNIPYRFARLDLFAESERWLDWYWGAESRSLTLGLSGSLAFTPYLFPLSLEAGWRFQSYPEYDGERYESFYLSARTSFLGVERPVDTSQVPQSLWKSDWGVKAWGGYELFGLGTIRASGEDEPRFYGPRSEVTLAKAGVGFTPPLGVGIWGRLWSGMLSAGDLVASLRATYTPFMSWCDWEGKLYRSGGFDLFVEPGLDHEGDPFFRTGAFATFSILPFFLPLSLEAGWTSYRKTMERWRWPEPPSDTVISYSRFYFMLSTSLVNAGFPIGATPSEIRHPFANPFKGLTPWVAYEIFGFAAGLSEEDAPYGFGDIYDYSPELGKYEITYARVGMGLAPPLGFGLWARLWQGSHSNDRGPVFSLRASYTPLMVWKEGVYGSYRFARLDLFAEPGWDDANNSYFRAGVCGSFTLTPFLPGLSLEAGLAKSPDSSGEDLSPYFLVSTSLVAADFPLQKGPVSRTHISMPPPEGVRFWVGPSGFSGGAGFSITGTSDAVLSYEVTILQLGVGLAPPWGIGLWGRLWFGDLSDRRDVFSVRASYSPFISWDEWSGYSRRRTRIDVFAEPGWDRGNRFYFRTGISASFAPVPVFLPVSAEAGWAYNGGSRFYLLLSLSGAGGEFGLKLK